MSDFSVQADKVELPRGASAASLRQNVRWRGRTVLSLTQGQYRAYLHPVYTPKGIPVTTESPPDHPHHNGIWLAADRVNCALPFSVDDFEYATYNFYVNETFQGRSPGRILSKGIKQEVVTGAHLRLVQDLVWVGPPEWGTTDGRTVLRETRTLDILPGENANVFDLRSRLTATEWDITLGPTRHAYFGVRTAEPLQGGQGGEFSDAHGRTGSADITGSLAPWIDCSGWVTRDHFAGIAIFRPPSEAPYPWQVADYGTITINPLREQHRKLRAGESCEYTIRIVVHDGDVHSAKIGERYESYCQHTE
ncbi:MAG: PmoA family protein [Candidatus Latescibacteria bacterium]|jgi:hypothetical protein|nr:PmoA family protein [Candidatus Latescibacterota bacterium]